MQSENQLKVSLVGLIGWESCLSNKENAQAKNDMLDNVLINEIKDKHPVNCLMAAIRKLIVSGFWISQNRY